MDGVILIDKKQGCTSYDVVKLAKKYFNSRKIGHCGTLDPFATGLLIIGVNQGTKTMNFLEADFKEYIATIKLGEDTDTQDLTGKVIETKEIVPFTEYKLKKVFKQFKGVIMQTPPIYSAIRVNGMHLYDYARNNQKVEIKSREITIYKLQLLFFNKNTIEIKVRCSKGTYIRTLGVDIAHALNNCGHLISLRRTKVGNCDVKRANKIEDFSTSSIHLYSIADALNMKKIVINEEKMIKRIYNGHTLFFSCDEPYLLLINKEKKALAIYEKIDFEKYHCLRGLFDENTRY